MRQTLIYILGIHIPQTIFIFLKCLFKKNKCVSSQLIYDILIYFIILKFFLWFLFFIIDDNILIISNYLNRLTKKVQNLILKIIGDINVLILYTPLRFLSYIRCIYFNKIFIRNKGLFHKMKFGSQQLIDDVSNNVPSYTSRFWRKEMCFIIFLKYIRRKMLFEYRCIEWKFLNFQTYLPCDG